MKDHVLIALEHETGARQTMHFGVSRRAHQLLPTAAIASGFVFDDETQLWTREPTDAAIDTEIKRTQWGAAGAVVNWWRLKAGELPPRPERGTDNVVDLPRFLQAPSDPAQPAIAPEMLAREAEFTQRATEVVEAARQSIEASRSDNSRITALEQQVTKIQDILVNLAERWGKQ
jgi:hypothetical protein